MRSGTTSRGRAAIAVLALVAAVTPVLLVSTAERASALPAGFAETTVISGLSQPMDMEFSPDGDVFVAEKRGVLKRYDGLADTTPTTVLDLRTKVYNGGDRGLMSFVLAPDFPQDPSVWVLYAHDAAIGGTAPRWGQPGVDGDPCPSPPGATADGCVVSGRLSKLDLSQPSGGTEQVLIEDWCQQYPSHSVGDLAFGPDGYLYASAGDGASYTFADYGQDGNPVNPCGDPPGGVGGSMTVPTAEGGALRSQDVQTLADPMGLDGTVIRVDPDTGAGAPGNPLATSSDANARRVVGAGLRNPFRFTFRPGTDELYVGDVGWVTWEEINRLENPIDGTVDNFGWPCVEGDDDSNGYTNLGLNLCNRIASGAAPTVAPHYTYRHGTPVLTGDGCATGGSSSSGVAFYEGSSYPAAYHGALFFADYSRQCIWTMRAGANGVPDPATRAAFRPSGAFPVSLESGPNGDIFYVDIAAGAVRRITATGSNTPPTAAITATPSSGALPLTVNLSAAGSSDVEPGALTYAWDLDGDGAYDDATGLTASRTYTVAGEYHPVVRVTDSGGQSATASTRVLAGTTPPQPVINTPAAGFTWSTGDSIAFSGSASDADDGALPASALDWDVILHHCVTIDACHEHLVDSIDGAASGSIVAPDHEYPAYLELRLTATDSSGVRTTVSRTLQPKVRNLQIVTAPAGLSATVTSHTGTGPFTVPVISGSRQTISTPATQTLGGTAYEFVSWSDGGARVHDITAAATDQTLTATFQRVDGDESLVAAYGFDEGAGTTLSDRSGRGNNGTVSGASWDPTGGHTGGALAFDGVNDIVNVADSGSLDLTTGMTVEAWVRPAVAAGWRTAVLKEAPGGLRYALYSSGADQPSAYVNTGGADVGVDAPASVPVNAWTHLAATYDGSALRFYVGGTLVATRAQTGPLATSTSPLRLGGNTVWGEWFSGRMDDVRIYNRALSAAEIVADRDTPVSADTEAPTAPGGLTSTGGLGSASLSWTAATDNVGVTAYDVHRSTTAGFTPAPANRIASPTGTSYADSGLAAGPYYYRVIARDAAGNASPASNQASAVVTGDTTPPTVSLTAPAAGSTVSGTIAVSANAADAGGVAGVQFRVDGAVLGAEDTSSPYSVQWNTAAIANGSHTLTAVARDAAGNTTTSAPVTVTVNNAVPTNLIAAYSFDGGAGPSLADNTGRGHTGTIAGATWSTAGHTGGALSFDGVNDSVSIADAADLDLTTGMTLEAWVRPTSRTGWATAVMKERPSGLDFALYTGDGADRPSGWNRVGTLEADATGPTALPLATWSHLAVTYDGTTLRLYVNGTQVAQRARTGPITTSTGVLRLGGNGVWGEYFNGLLDDVRVFNVARTPAQIATDRDTPVS